MVSVIVASGTNASFCMDTPPRLARLFFCYPWREDTLRGSRSAVRRRPCPERGLRTQGSREGLLVISDLMQDFADALDAMPRAHPRQRILQLLDEALRRDASFIARHP